VQNFDNHRQRSPSDPLITDLGVQSSRPTFELSSAAGLHYLFLPAGGVSFSGRMCEKSKKRLMVG